MQQSFKAYMQATYEHNELADIATHGCASGCASGMIYYSETIALFDQYRDDLFSIMADFQEQCGYSELPSFGDAEQCFSTFANAVVWFCAELIAYELTQGEYIDETEEAA